MLAVQRQPGNMFRAPSSTESPTAHRYYHDRRPSHASSTSLPSVGPPPRSVIELPHPLEPRTGSHHASHASIQESLPGSRHLDGHRHTPSTARPSLPLSTDTRPSGPSLPGLRDILTPTPGPSSNAVGYSPWSAPRPSPPAHSTNGASAPRSGGSADMYHSYPSTWHPPMALHVPPETVSHYHTSTERRMEAGLTEHSPSARGSITGLPVSPYSAYPDGRDYTDARSEQRPPPPMSYHSNGGVNPYPPAPEEHHYASAASVYDRSQLPPDPSAAPECQRKYVGIKDIPGEGSFHMYEGGYRLPTHVDGEQVNPAWGLTKANKPRKRLALACLDCREKKIKCEPGAASCLQCEKAKRPCRRAPAQLASTESGSAVPAWPNATASPPSQLPPSLPPSSRSYAESSPPRTTHAVRDADGEPPARRAPPSPLEQHHPAKKLRSASPLPLQQQQHPSQRRPLDTSAAARYGNVYSPPQRPVSRELVWEEDPYVVNRDATLHLAELYFSHINSAVFDLFPRNTFMQWLSTCSDKTPEERMVLYAMLAVAARFADAVLADFGRYCGEVAAQAISSRHAHCTLLDVQARLLRCLYDSAHGHDDAAWEMLGAAIRGATGKRLKLNLEKNCLADAEASGSSRLPFRFGSEQLAECHRRTFWACFLMDRFSGGSHCAISHQNVFVRLPCSDDVYERGWPSDAPLFSDSAANTISSSPASARMSAMAWLILFASVWGDVLDFLHRAPHRPESTYPHEYDDFYQRTHSELQHLVSRLPEHLRYDVGNGANLERSLREGYAAWFVTMHALYHFVLIRLNRRMRHHLMLDKVARNIRAAHYHGHTLLAIMGELRRAKSEVVTPHGQRIDVAFSSPFPSAMVMEAIDVVSAGGFESGLGVTMDAIDGGIAVLRELSVHWATADEQARACQRRLYQIRNVLSHPFKAKGGCWLGREWGMIDPLDNDLDMKDDCIYGPSASEGKPNAIYFDALKDTHYDYGRQHTGVRVAG